MNLEKVFFGFFITKAVDMGDIVPHMRVIDRALRFGFPSVIGTVVIGENSDNMDIIHVAKCVF